MLSAFRPQAGYSNLGDWDLAGVANALGGAGTRVFTGAGLWKALNVAAPRGGAFISST